MDTIESQLKHALHENDHKTAEETIWHTFAKCDSDMAVLSLAKRLLDNCLLRYTPAHELHRWAACRRLFQSHVSTITRSVMLSSIVDVLRRTHAVDVFEYVGTHLVELLQSGYFDFAFLANVRVEGPQLTALWRAQHVLCTYIRLAVRTQGFSATFSSVGGVTSCCMMKHQSMVLLFCVQMESQFPACRRKLYSAVKAAMSIVHATKCFKTEAMWVGLLHIVNSILHAIVPELAACNILSPITRKPLKDVIRTCRQCNSMQTPDPKANLRARVLRITGAQQYATSVCVQNYARIGTLNGRVNGMKSITSRGRAKRKRRL